MKGPHFGGGSMRGSDNRVPLLTAIFMALLLAAVPGPAYAQALSFPQTSTPAQNCTQTDPVQKCQCQMNNGHTQRAQGQTVANLKIFSNTSITSMKWVYCFDSMIMPALQSIGTITSSANGANPLGGL